MIGRVYINEIGTDAAALDFSAWPSEVLDQNLEYGFPYLKTLEHLGFRHEVAPSGRSLLMESRVEDVKQNIPKLSKHIGLIARYGAKLEQHPSLGTRNNIGRILGNLTQHTIPELPDDARISQLASAVTRPFADAASDPKELFEIIHGYKPWWFEENARTGRAKEWQQRNELIQAFTAEQEISR